MGPPPKQIRIVGAGLAGLALADALMQRGFCCTLVDRKGIASGASGAASGLLHPLPGLRAQPGWRAFEAFQQAAASVHRRAFREPAVIGARGVFRPVTEVQRRDFLHAAASGWASWCQQGPPVAIPSGLAREGLWMEEGLVVDVPLYLQIWVHELQQQGLTFVIQDELSPVEQKTDDLREPENLADPSMTTVWCTGIEARGFLPGIHEVVRGQALCVLPPPLPLECGIAGRSYIAPLRQGWVVGATFEHGNLSPVGSAELAREALRRRVEDLWPEGGLLDLPVQQMHVGHRLSTPDHMPVCGRLPNGDWVYTGLGSKGLLYHVYLAQELAQAIAEQRPERLPCEVALNRVGLAKQDRLRVRRSEAEPTDREGRG